MKEINRRGFLRSSAVLTAASQMRILGANDRIRMAVIGVRGRGRDHISIYGKLPNSTVAGVCDIDQAQNERAATLTEQVQGSKPKTYKDLRKLLEDKEIDAVSIATCNHWHALATIWACQAGKDVYCEKPASHNMFEGTRMLAVARQHNRIVQVGMQSRSLEYKQRAMELLRQGAIGKVYLAKGLCFKRRKSIGRTPDGPVPAGVDWDLFLGPAPMRAFNPNRFHYNWHWFWDTGNGDIGNQGVHEMDLARWGLGKKGLPKSVVSTGGKFAYDDDQETPNTLLTTFEYDDCKMVFEVRGLLTNGEGSIKYDGSNYIGDLYYGTEGFMSLDQESCKIFKGEKGELVDEIRYGEPKIWDTTPHMQNFQKAMRSRKVADLNCDVEEGVTSAALCHMANISYRTGRKLDWDGERFVGDEAANGLMTRKYRAPYVVS